MSVDLPAFGRPGERHLEAFGRIGVVILLILGLLLEALEGEVP